MKIAISGGGPAGLYCALLAKRKLANVDVTVYEQNPRGATYGFGIVLADRGLNRLRKADVETSAAISAASFLSRHRILSLRGESIFIEGGGYGNAIARLTLINILQAACEQAGVKIHHDRRIDHPTSLKADVVIGADGVNSVVRGSRQAAFGTTSYLLTNRIAWYGTKQHFPYPILCFKEAAGGIFWGVGYAYTELMSTFVAECDAETWTRSGFDQMSDEQRMRTTEKIFAAELDGNPLISNRSIWHQLPVTRSQNWFVDNAVLIGDALHSAHPTIGSGTRIAMEDAITLVDALVAERDLTKAFERFREQREPEKQKLVGAAERSVAWYEDIAQRLPSLDVQTLTFDFLTRTGRLDEARLQSEYPQFMDRYRQQWQSFAQTNFRRAAAP